MCDQTWMVKIDVLDANLNVNDCWPGRADEGHQKKLEIVEWVRRDGLPGWLVFGTPRLLSPAQQIATYVDSENKRQLASLRNWLL